MQPASGRVRAQRLYPALALCEECGAVPATDRHHKDGDTFNNDRSNVAMLCRRCHMVVDGRIAHATHCARGHEYTPANTRLRIRANGRTSRVCRACDALTTAARRRAKGA